MKQFTKIAMIGISFGCVALCFYALNIVTADAKAPTTISAAPLSLKGDKKVQAGDFNQWLGSPLRNNVSDAKYVPSDWTITMDPKSGKFVPEKSKNVKWATQLGSQTYGNTVVANGKVYV